MKDKKKGLIIKNILSPQKSIYPVVPLRNIVVFPDMTIPLFIGRSATLKTVKKSLSADSIMVVVAQKTANVEIPTSKDIYQVGIFRKNYSGKLFAQYNIKILFEASKRVKLSKFTKQKGLFQLAETQSFKLCVRKNRFKSAELMNAILHHLPNFLGRKSKTGEILDLLEKLKTQPSHFCNFLISILNI